MKRLAMILILFTLLVAQGNAQPPVRQPSESPPGMPGQGGEDDDSPSNGSIGGGLALLLVLG
ncbi:MAG: hypothetical protein ACLFMU_07640, partial [Bacteroidales bacterium]